MEEEVEFELSDIYVDTVGLVSAGAIGEDFFLTKKKGVSKMTDELNAEVVDPETPSFWDRLRKLLREERPQEVVVTEPAETLVAEINTEVKTVEDKVEKVEKVVEPVAPAMPEKTIAPEKSVAPVAIPVVDFSEAITKVEKVLTDKYGAEITALRERLEKSETEAVKIKEEAAERDMIQKARNFPALPIRYDELGKKLYGFSKVLKAEDFEWLMATFAAVDKQLGTAGILNELGTSKSPEELAIEDKVEKVAKDEKKSYTDAMLSLPKAEQEQLLAQMRK